MEKQFTVLLAATTRRTEDLNASWHKVIAYAVKKAHSDKEHGLEYVQAALDAAVGGVRKGVASAFRQLNLNISALENHQYRAEGVRNPKNQEATFERIKAGEIPDVVAMVDRLPKAKKDPAKRDAKEVAQEAIDRLIARLKKDAPEAAAIVNNRLAGGTEVVEVERVVEKYTPNSIALGDAEDIMVCSADEIAAAISAVLAMRVPALKAA